MASGDVLQPGIRLSPTLVEAMQIQTLDTDQKNLRALAGQRAVRDALLQMMDRERVDALSFPDCSGLRAAARPAPAARDDAAVAGGANQLLSNRRNERASDLLIEEVVVHARRGPDATP